MKVLFPIYCRKIAIKVSSVTLQLKLPVWMKYAETSKRKTLAEACDGYHFIRSFYTFECLAPWSPFLFQAAVDTQVLAGLHMPLRDTPLAL